MKHFFRAGRVLPINQKYNYKILHTDRVGSSTDTAPHLVTNTPTVYHLSSAQDLPWFYLCSTSLRSFYDVAMKWLRPSIGAASESHRSGIRVASEKGRTRLGLGRVLIGTSMPSVLRKLLPRNRYAIACNAVLTHRYYLANAWQALIQRFKGMDIPQIKHRLSKDVVLFTQLLRRKSRVQKACFVGTFLQLDHSAADARSIGIDSGFGRTISEACSTAVRELFDFSSTTSRRTVEGQSNSTRRDVEAFPKPSRTRVEALPNSSRRIVEAESKTARSGCENITFQKGARTKVELALTQPKTKVELGMNYQTTKDELTTSLARTNNGLAKDTEKYGKGAGEVLKSGGKGTKEVLESYQSGTKDVLTGSRSAVAQLTDVMPSGEDISSDIVNSVEDIRTNRLILASFREFCEDFGGKVRSLGVDVNRSSQIALKELIGFKVQSKPFACSLRLIELTIFCVFSFPDLLGARAVAQTPQHRDTVPKVQSPATIVASTGLDSENKLLISYKYIFNAIADKHNEKYVSRELIKRYPLVIYDFDYKQTPNVKIGDKLPEFLKAIAFQYVDREGETKIGTLSEFMDSKLLILDFWATWCSPCVESMDKWNAITKEIDGVKVLGVMLDHNIRAQYFGASRDWVIPILFGPETNIINSFFFDRQVISRSAWIMDGKLVGITNTKGYNTEVVRDLINGKSVDLPMASEWIYSTSN